MNTYNIPNTDLVVSRIAYGGGELGGSWDRTPIKPDTVVDAARLIQTAVDSGITLFDFADVYCYGKSELAFGEVMKQSPRLRPAVVLQSKCGIRWEDEPQPGCPRRLDFSREHIVSSAEDSLRRLRTDWLDIFLLHHPDPLIRPDEVAEALTELKRSGKVRYFGVSNYSASQIAQLQGSIPEPLVINQIALGLSKPAFINEGMDTTLALIAPQKGLSSSHATIRADGILDYCQQHGVQIQAYSPLRGIPLTALASDNSPSTPSLARILREIAKAKGVSASAVSLAWLLSHPAKILPIMETHNPVHLIENIAAVNVTLSREEWYRLWASSAGSPQ